MFIQLQLSEVIFDLTESQTSPILLYYWIQFDDIDSTTNLANQKLINAFTAPILKYKYQSAGLKYPNVSISDTPFILTGQPFPLYYSNTLTFAPPAISTASIMVNAISGNFYSLFCTNHKN